MFLWFLFHQKEEHLGDDGIFWTKPVNMHLTKEVAKLFLINHVVSKILSTLIGMHARDEESGEPMDWPTKLASCPHNF